MGPNQRKALLEEYRQLLVDEDEVGIERVLAEAPDDADFLSALSDIHHWYEERYGLTPSPEDQREGLEQLQKLLGTDCGLDTTSPPPDEPEAPPVDPSALGTPAGDGASVPSPEVSPGAGSRARREQRRAKGGTSARSTGDRPEAKRANAYQKGVLAARIVHLLHDEPTFGDVKFQKVIYMVEHHAQLEELQSNYRRYAYGPHDTKLFNGAKGMMKKNGWFEAAKRKGRTYFESMSNPDGYLTTYENVWGDKDEEITRVIESFRRLRTRTAEVIATVYAVWNDFLIEGRVIEDAALIHEARYNWDPKKEAIGDREWADGLAWLRERGLVPTGFGRLTVRS